MDVFQNFDLLTVGIVTAGIGILGFTLYINNRRSITNQTFLMLSVVSIVWSILNYLSYQLILPNQLFLIRGELFCAIWHTYYFFKFLYVLPEETVTFPRYYQRFLIPWVCLLSLLTLSNLVAATPGSYSGDGHLISFLPGPLIPFFGLTIVILLISAFIILIRKIVRAKSGQKAPLVYILIGTLTTFFLIITFIFIYPAFRGDSHYIIYGALFNFPLIALTSYAIYQRKLLNVRAASVSVITSVLCVVSFLEIIFSNTLVLIIFRSAVFLIVLAISILMNRFVETIAEQREELERANERQEGLIHFISHQIKGYLTKSKAAFAGILEGDFGEVSENVKSVAKEGLKDNQEGVETVMSILSAANLKSGTVTYKRESLDFRKLVIDQIDSHRKAAVDKGLRFESQIDQEPNYALIGDGEQLSKHVIGNLIDNSIKYTL